MGPCDSTRVFAGGVTLLLSLHAMLSPTAATKRFLRDCSGLVPTLTQVCLSAFRHCQAIGSPDLETVPDILLPLFAFQNLGAFILYPELQGTPDSLCLLLNLTSKMLLGRKKKQRI